MIGNRQRVLNKVFEKRSMTIHVAMIFKKKDEKQHEQLMNITITLFISMTKIFSIQKYTKSSIVTVITL